MPYLPRYQREGVGRKASAARRVEGRGCLHEPYRAGLNEIVPLRSAEKPRRDVYHERKIILDKATANTLVAFEDFLRTEHTLFEPCQLKYRTGLKPVKKYKYVWDHTEHERAPRERSDNAIVSYMSAVRAYWRWCMDMGYTQNDPFRKYSVGSQKYGTPYYLTTEERDLLYKVLFDMRKDISDLKQQMAQQSAQTAQPVVNVGTPMVKVGASDSSEDFQQVEEVRDEPDSIADMEKETIRRALERYRGNRKATALAIGMGERTLYRKIKEYGL